MTIPTQQQPQDGAAGAPPAPAAAPTTPTGAAGAAPPAAPAAPAPAQQAAPAAAPRRPTTADLPPVALSERLKRAEKAERERWARELGVDDPAKAKEKLARLAELEKAQEEQKRAQMSELERIRADLEAERAAKTELQTQLDAMREEQLYSKQDALISGIATQFIDPDALDLARMHFAKHVREMAPEAQEKVTERDVKKFFERWSILHPKFAKSVETPASAAPPAPPAPGPASNVRGAPGAKPGARVPPVGAMRRPITNGAPPAKREPAPAGGGGNDPTIEAGKTTKPGQKNSMSKAELRAFAAKHGVNYP